MTTMSDPSHAGLTFANNVTALFGLAGFGPTSSHFPSALGTSDVTAPSPYSPFTAAHAYDAAFCSVESAAEAWRCLSTAAATWSCDTASLAMGAAYPYPSPYSSLDVRRKNATRESTGTLKAWLMEHIKNPYPTKGEKVMLAIVTKMTLTQVSTWFANARRRLKKENKMQWSPRNRTGEDCEDDDDIDDVIDDDRVSSCSYSNVDETRPRSRSRLEGEERSLSESHCGSLNLLSPANDTAGRDDVASNVISISKSGAGAVDGDIAVPQQPMKPRIWSLVDVIASSSPTASTSSAPPHRPSPLTIRSSSTSANQGAEGVASLAYYKQHYQSHGLVTALPYDYSPATAMASRYYEQLNACTGLLEADTHSPSSLSIAASSSSASSSGPSRSVSPHLASH